MSIELWISLKELNIKNRLIIEIINITKMVKK